MDIWKQIEKKNPIQLPNGVLPICKLVFPNRSYHNRVCRGLWAKPSKALLNNTSMWNKAIKEIHLYFSIFFIVILSLFFWILNCTRKIKILLRYIVLMQHKNWEGGKVAYLAKFKMIVSLSFPYFLELHQPNVPLKMLFLI